MNKIIPSSQEEHAESVATDLPAPQGIGMAVAFDWGLAVQLAFTPLIPLFTKNAGPWPRLSSNTLLSALFSWLILLPFASLLAVFGEGLRRGWKWTRLTQVVANALLSIAGVASLWSLVGSLKAGNYWGLVTSVILVIFSPLIAWRLASRATRQWFQRVTSAQARRRHSGLWPWLIAVWALVGGVLQAFAAFLK